MIVLVCILPTSKAKMGGAIFLVLGLVLEWTLWKWIRKPFSKQDSQAAISKEARFHENGLEFATMKLRVRAGLIDGLIFAPLTVSLYFFHHWTKTRFEACKIMTYVMGIPYAVLMIGHYGQTLGKMAMKIKVFKNDGSPADYWSGFRRAGGDTLLCLILLVNYMIIIRAMPPEVFDGQSYWQITKAVGKLHVMIKWDTYLILAWYLSEFVSMRMNKRSRAVHDFIGGTVVLRTDKAH
ncbi:MAG: transporter [Fibrobacteres bacterium]|nr:transporter [Fibrobacterota bacterium]